MNPTGLKYNHKYFIKIQCGGPIQDPVLVSEILAKCIRASKEQARMPSAIVSIGYMEVNTGHFGILLENVSTIDYIKLVSLIVGNMLAITQETKAIGIANISALEIFPNDWEDLNFLLNVTSRTNEEEK